MSLNGAYAEFLKSKSLLHQPCGFSVPASAIESQLFPFQRDTVLWCLQRGRACVFYDCGLGKTPIQLRWADQASKRSGKPVIIFAPLAVSQQTRHEGEKFSVPVTICRKQADVRMGVNVTNYEMLEHFDSKAFGGIVLDECFPPDTLVDTSLGKMYIKDIRAGACIVNASGEDYVQAVRKRQVKRVVRITAGALFTCSSNHPWLTLYGWRRAEDLQPGDYLVGTEAAMRLVRGDLQPETFTPQAATFLRSVLLGEMADASTGDQGAGAQSRGKAESNTGYTALVGLGQPLCRDTAEADCQSESNARSRSQEESFPEIERTPTITSWRKRVRTNKTPTAFVASTGEILGYGLCDLVGQKARGLPYLLQSGSSLSQEEDSHRSGWAQSQSAKTTRQEEGYQTALTRVDAVEILELGHPSLDQYRDAEGNIYFYDLQAIRHPSYSVNGILVHNSSCLKGHDRITRLRLTEFASGISYRLACTATPAPNDFMELGTHAEWMGVMTRAEMLSMFFIHDGGDTGQWRLKGHGVDRFWKWVASWALLMRKPSDLGYEDNGFILPPLHYHQHTVPAEGAVSKGRLFAVEAKTMQERRGARKDSLQARIDLCAKLVNSSRDPWLIWCNLNAESEALTRAIQGAVQVTGSDSMDYKEKTLTAFAQGRGVDRLVTKPSIAGWGMNLQRCFNMAFVGLSDSWEELYQATRRCWRFGQKKPVHAHIITGELEGAVVRNIQRKEMQAAAMAEGMLRHMQTFNAAAVHGLERDRTEYLAKETMRIPDWMRS